MQKNLSIKTITAGIGHINCQTGAIHWEEKDVDPVSRQYAKKYLVYEGFIEQAIGALEPLPGLEVALLLNSLAA